jgi:hypothetical protein
LEPDEEFQKRLNHLHPFLCKLSHHIQTLYKDKIAQFLKFVRGC